MSMKTKFGTEGCCRPPAHAWLLGRLILELFDAQNVYKCQSIEYHNRTTCCKNKEKGVTGKYFMDDQNIALCDA